MCLDLRKCTSKSKSFIHSYWEYQPCQRMKQEFMELWHQTKLCKPNELLICLVVHFLCHHSGTVIPKWLHNQTIGLHSIFHLFARLFNAQITEQKTGSDVSEFSVHRFCHKIFVSFFKRKHQKYCVVFKVFYSYNKVIINVQIMAITWSIN